LVSVRGGEVLVDVMGDGVEVGALEEQADVMERQFEGIEDRIQEL